MDFRAHVKSETGFVHLTLSKLQEKFEKHSELTTVFVVDSIDVLQHTKHTKLAFETVASVLTQLLPNAARISYDLHQRNGGLIAKRTEYLLGNGICLIADSQSGEIASLFCPCVCRSSACPCLCSPPAWIQLVTARVLVHCDRRLSGRRYVRVLATRKDFQVGCGKNKQYKANIEIHDPQRCGFRVQEVDGIEFQVFHPAWIEK